MIFTKDRIAEERKTLEWVRQQMKEEEKARVEEKEAAAVEKGPAAEKREPKNKVKEETK